MPTRRYRSFISAKTGPRKRHGRYLRHRKTNRDRDVRHRLTHRGLEGPVPTGQDLRGRCDAPALGLMQPPASGIALRDGFVEPRHVDALAPVKGMEHLTALFDCTHPASRVRGWKHCSYGAVVERRGRPSLHIYKVIVYYVPFANGRVAPWVQPRYPLAALRLGDGHIVQRDCLARPAETEPPV